MKKQVFVATLAASLGLSLAGSALAQTPAGPPAAVKLGIINIQRAIVECDEGKKAAERLQTQFTPKRSELQARQAEIEKLQKQLREQEKTLSDEARNNLVRQVETKTKEFTRSNEDFTNDMQQAEAQVINEIGQKVMKVLDEYARKGGYHVVLDVSSSQTVLWASSAVDVTDEIIKLYNAAPPSSPAASGGSAPTPAPARPAVKPSATPGAPAAKPSTTPGAPAAKPSTTPGTPAVKKPAAPPR